MLLPREGPPSNSTSGPQHSSGSGGISTGVIAAIAIVAVLFSLLSTYSILRLLRRRNNNPKYIPTQYLKRKWEAWQPGSSKPNYSAQLQNANPQTSQLSNGNASSNDPERGARTANADTVERHTSIRSIMTLPAYSRSVRENERILGREGERDGIDVVVEAPETEHEEEERRDQEMESLYQIRVQRRQEMAQREDRRQRRAAARERGDAAETERIRQESLTARDQREAHGVTAMVNLHNTRNRDRRLGSVSYADVGVARPDGTRIRANSNDSQRPLLDSAASLAGSSSLRPWTTRESSFVSSHRRGNNSVTSLPISEDSADLADRSDASPYRNAGSDFDIVNLNDGSNSARSRNNSHTIYTPSASRSRSRASTTATNGIRPSIDTGSSNPNVNSSGELTEELRIIPAEDPPVYNAEGFEDAPPYSSPVQSRVPSQRLSASLDAPAQNSSAEEQTSGLAVESEIVQNAGNAADESRGEQIAPSLLPTISRLPSIRIADATPIEDEWPVNFATVVAGDTHTPAMGTTTSQVRTESDITNGS